MTLTVVSNPRCGGDIAGEPHHADWRFYPTDNVSLKATAYPGYTFVNWTGDVDWVADTSQSTMTVQMSRYDAIYKRQLQITANFAAPGGLYTVAVQGKPCEGGSVSILAPCGPFTTDNVQPVISMQFAAGTEVVLNAVPAQGYRFRRWTGDLSGSQDNLTLTVDSSKSITAAFAKRSAFPWGWTVIGVAASCIAVFAVARLVRGKTRRQQPAAGSVPQAGPQGTGEV